MLLVLGVLSRFYSLSAYSRLVESETRAHTPSRLIGRPVFTVESDRPWLTRIVVGTYAVLLTGMVSLMAGVLLGI